MGERRSTPDASDEVITQIPTAARSSSPGPFKVLAAGTQIDHFEVVRLLGHGGMGMVYLARDKELGRRVALKLIRREYLSERGVEIFLREARATATFNHPHIVTIYAAGRWKKHPYVALEFLEGDDLRARLTKTPPTRQETVRIMLGVAQGLAEAHRHGILHRDLKPENVFIPADGRVRVVDFGLARPAVGIDALTALRTAIDLRTPKDGSSGLVGTPEYMAPEQWLMLPPATHVDIWAFGVVLYELLTGEVPFPLRPGESVLNLSVRVMDGEAYPPLPGDTFEGLAGLVEQCLERDPANRPTAEDLVARLERSLDAGPSLLFDEEVGPFRGLLAYGEEHAHALFGRDAELDMFIERSRHRGILPVVGPSGAGKSSFVMAGAVPRLRERGYGCVLGMRPLNAPFGALARRVLDPDGRAGPLDKELVAALAVDLEHDPQRLNRELAALAIRRETKVLLVVDQLEEVITHQQDVERQARFLVALCLAADDVDDQVRVILSMRDDYLGRMAVAPEVQRALASVTVLRAPTGRVLVDILRQTASLAGCRFEDASLPRDMVREVQGEPTALPLLQFASQLLWRDRDRERQQLRRTTYEAMGGVGGALASHAEEVLGGLSGRELALARALLLRLVTTERTRRITTADEVLREQPREAEAVLQRFIDSRLVLAQRQDGGGRRLELAHESLVRNWRTLTGWLDASVGELQFLEELTAASKLWDQRGRQNAELWQGDALRDGQMRLEQAPGAQVPEVARAFLDEGLAMHRRRRRRRWLALAATILSLSGIALFSFVQKRRADTQRDAAQYEKAKAEEREARSTLEAARAAYSNGSYLEARAKLRASLEQRDDILARALWWQLDRELKRWTVSLNTIPYDVAVSPNGRWAAVPSQNHIVYLLDTVTGRATPLRKHRDQVTTAAFSPDGRWLVTLDWSGNAVRWSTEDWRATGPQWAHDGQSTGLAFSRRGDRFFTVGTDGHLRGWTTEEGREVMDLELGGKTGRTIVVDPSGRSLFLAMGAEIQQWGLDSGRKLRSYPLPWPGSYHVAMSPKGDRLALTNLGLGVGVLELESGRFRELWAGRAVRTTFDASGNQLAFTKRSGGVQFVDVDSGRQVSTVELDTSARAVTLLPDGEHVIATSIRSVHLVRWPRQGRGAVGRHQGGVIALAFSPDGKQLATGGYDQQIILWDAATGRAQARLQGHQDAVHNLIYTSPKWLISAGADRQVRRWDLESRHTERLWGDARGALYALARDPERERVAAATISGQVHVWDERSWKLLRTLQHGDRSFVTSLLALPDGRFLSLGRDQALRSFGLDAGAPRQEQEGLDWGHAMALRGQELLVAGAGLWRGTLGQPMTQIRKLPGRRLYGVQWLHDGRHAVMGGANGVLERVDTQTGRVTHQRRAHLSELNRVVVAPRGDTVATASDDGTVRLWSADELRPLWRGSAMLSRPARFHSHLGWVDLETGVDVDEGPLERAARERGRRSRSSSDGTITCLLVDEGKVELWRRSEQRPTVTAPSDGPFAATDDGCVTVHEGSLRWLTRDGGRRRAEVGEATALATDGAHVLVAVEGAVIEVDAKGTESRRFATTGHVRALLPLGEEVLAGFVDGSLQALSASGGPARSFVSSRGVITVLAAGPHGIVIGGQAEGTVAMWDGKTGNLLAEEPLHGPIHHLTLDGHRLFVGSDLGQHTVWDLEPLFQSYCALLERVQADISVRWEEGGPVPAPPRPCEALPGSKMRAAPRHDAN